LLPRKQTFSFAPRMRARARSRSLSIGILLEKREFELGRLGTSVDIASDVCFFGSFCYDDLRLTMAAIP